jgi:hypothetical protein
MGLTCMCFQHDYSFCRDKGESTCCIDYNVIVIDNNNTFGGVLQLVSPIRMNISVDLFASCHFVLVQYLFDKNRLPDRFREILAGKVQVDLHALKYLYGKDKQARNSDKISLFHYNVLVCDLKCTVSIN